jgi:hypothetical protein
MANQKDRNLSNTLWDFSDKHGDVVTEQWRFDNTRSDLSKPNGVPGALGVTADRFTGGNNPFYLTLCLGLWKDMLWLSQNQDFLILDLLWMNQPLKRWSRKNYSARHQNLYTQFLAYGIRTFLRDLFSVAAIHIALQYVYIYMYVCMYVYIYVCVYVCMYVCSFSG